MTFLSALLPGVRDLRVPLAIGGMWIAFIAVLTVPRRTELSTTPLWTLANDLLDPWPTWATGAVLIFGSYLLGVVAQELAAPFQRLAVERRPRLGTRWQAFQAERRLKAIDRGRYPKQRDWDLPEVGLSSMTPPWKQTLNNVCSSWLPSHFTEVVNDFPLKLFRTEFDYAVLQLSKEAPEQFQQYDKSRAEAELRLGVAVPLAAIGIAVGLTAGSQSGWILALALVVAAGVIWRVGILLDRKALGLLTSSILLGYCSTPMLDELHSAIDRQPLVDETDVRIEIVRFLHRHALYDSVVEIDYLLFAIEQHGGRERFNERLAYRVRYDIRMALSDMNLGDRPELADEGDPY